MICKKWFVKSLEGSQQWVKPLVIAHQSIRKRNNRLSNKLWLLFFGMHMEKSLSTTLIKEGRLLEHIMLHHWVDWLAKSGRNGHIWRKEILFMMIMHQLTHRTFHRQKSKNWVSSRFRIHGILQTWPPTTTQVYKIWGCNCYRNTDGHFRSNFSRRNRIRAQNFSIMSGFRVILT